MVYLQFRSEAEGQDAMLATQKRCSSVYYRTLVATALRLKVQDLL